VRAGRVSVFFFRKSPQRFQGGGPRGKLSVARGRDAAVGIEAAPGVDMALGRDAALGIEAAMGRQALREW